MTLKKMIRALLVAMLASVLVYGVMVVVSDGPGVVKALRGFSVPVLLLMMALTVAGYLVRGYRWGRLMRLMGHPVSPREAEYLHLSGLTMGVSPGRLGEVLKPWLAREVAGLPMSEGVTLVFCERVADLIAVFLLALGGVSALGGGVWVMVFATAVIIVGIWIAASKWFHEFALRILSTSSWMRKHEGSVHAVSETIRSALSWRALWWSTGLSVIAWSAEAIAFAMCVRELGFAGLEPPVTMSVYAVSAIVGAFTFLPGGIGFTEASIAGIMTAAGMPAASASAATLITRVVTLWLGVLLGWIVLFTRPALLRRLLASDVDQASIGSNRSKSSNL